MTRHAPYAAWIVLALFGSQARPGSQPQAGYSAPALYNSANAYARAGKPALSVLNYERARMLDPNDPDIDANLRHLRETSGLPPETRTRFERIAQKANPRILAWIGELGLIVAGAGILLKKMYPRHRRKLGAAAILGVSMAGVALCNAIAWWPTLNESVVIAHTAQGRVAPVPMGEPLFVLREAEVVKTGSRHDSFVLVQNSAGRQGWVAIENLAPVVPPARP